MLRQKIKQWVLSAGLPNPVYLAKIVPKLNGIMVRECPCCGYRGKFAAYGEPPRFDAECRKCGSLERHRFIILTVEREKLLKQSDHVLHFAPEPVLTKYLSKMVGQYVSADVREGRADRVENIEKISLPDRSLDVVIAIHVLEHVDDRKALSEIRRVLRQGGRFICAVPIIEGWAETYENPTIVDPAEREIYFGQYDHVRYYGRDFRDRLHQQGFRFDEYTASNEDAIRYGLIRGEKLFICHPLG